MSSKPKFRSRKLDYKRPLPIYQEKELPDLDDDAHRAVPVVATGVEKEEEEEHHLQAVISASQVRDSDASKANANLYIPTPDASKLIDFYSEYYNRVFKRPKTLIRFSLGVEDCCGPSYCMDDEDVEWLVSYNTGVDESLKLQEIEFESVVSELESITDKGQVENPEFYTEISDLDGTSIATTPSAAMKACLSPLHQYWKQKRMKKNGKPLIEELKFEEATKGETDPFICFRRREVRITRKTRKADAQSLQKLRQLRSEMESARTMLEMVTRRERMKKEHLLLEQAIFEQKLLVKKTKREFQIPDAVFEEARLSRKKANKIRISTTQNTRPIKPKSTRKRKQSITEDDIALKDPIMIAIENDVNIKRSLMAGWEDLTETGVNMYSHPASNFFTNIEGSDISFNTNSCKLRRRIGRGGRLLIDRHRNIKEQMVNDPFKYSSFAEPIDDGYESGSGNSGNCDEEIFKRLFALRLHQLDSLDLSKLLPKHLSSKDIPEEAKPSLKLNSALLKSSSTSAISSKKNKIIRNSSVSSIDNSKDATAEVVQVPET